MLLLVTHAFGDCTADDPPLKFQNPVVDNTLSIEICLPELLQEQQFVWSLGDGNSVVTTSPKIVYEYSNAGHYEVVVSSSHSPSLSTSCSATVLACTQYLSEEPVVIVESAFMSHSSKARVCMSSFEGVKKLKWDFGDGSPAESFKDVKDGSLVEHVFSSPGVFKVSVKVKHDNDDAKTYEKEAVVYCPGDSGFMHTGPGLVKQEVTFTACSIGSLSADKLKWDFGDGSSMTVKSKLSVGHRFKRPGLYKVKLKDDTEPGYSAKIPVLDCEHLPSNHISIVAREAGKEKKVILSACSEEALSEGYHYIWDFGDGKQETITKHGMITDHEFKKEGKYQVRVSIVHPETGVTKNTTATIKIKVNPFSPATSSSSPDSRSTKRSGSSSESDGHSTYMLALVAVAAGVAFIVSVVLLVLIVRRVQRARIVTAQSRQGYKELSS